MTDPITQPVMKCGVCIEPGTFEIQECPLPMTAPDGWVLIDVNAVGICGTDYHIFEGKHPFLNYPRVIGHELSGTIVQSYGEWDQGVLVVINPYVSCGTCRSCKRGKPNCCSNIEVLGVHRDGGMCARLAVPDENIYPAKGLKPIAAAMVEFLAIGAHAVRRSQMESGDRVLVTGVGPIGLGTALFARQAGGEVHLRDTSQARLAMARNKFGFTDTHLAQDELLQGDLADGFDIVFDATGNGKAIEAGFQLVAHGGSYVLVSVVKDEITFEDPEFHKREMRLIGSRNALKEDFDQVIESLASGAIDSDALCSEVLQLAELPDRFDALSKNRETLIKAIVAFD